MALLTLAGALNNSLDVLLVSEETTEMLLLATNPIHSSLYNHYNSDVSMVGLSGLVRWPNTHTPSPWPLSLHSDVPDSLMTGATS